MKNFWVVLSLIALLNMPLGAYSLTVQNGTELYINPDVSVTSKSVQGNNIRATIKDDVVVNGQVVFKAGDRASFTIADRDKAGAFGFGGKLWLGNGYATDAKGVKRKILISQQIDGDDKNWVKVLTACGLVLWPLLLFGFVHGEEARINSTYEIQATTASDFAF